MLSPPFLEQDDVRFQRHLCGQPVSVHHTGCPVTALHATAKATELGIILLQNFTPLQIQRHIHMMEQEKRDTHHRVPRCGGGNCATCGMYVHDSEWVGHVQGHVGAAYMASIFPPYDPEDPSVT